MEGQNTDSGRRKFDVLFAEAFGTMGLVFTINMSRGAGLSIGLYITLAACIFGGISGGHFNGAVSLGVLIKEKKF